MPVHLALSVDLQCIDQVNAHLFDRSLTEFPFFFFCLCLALKSQFAAFVLTNFLPNMGRLQYHTELTSECCRKFFDRLEKN